MHPDRWQEISRLYHAALERDDLTERADFLENACAGDDDLRQRVAALIARDSTGQAFLTVPAIELAGPFVGDPPWAPAAGTQIGSYKLLSLLGQGGMGTVSCALDTKLNRAVAIKFLSDDVADAAARRRFQREAQTASSLNHPHILSVYDVGEFEGRQYIVTELVDGGTLSDWARRETRTWQEIVDLLTGIADALAAAHHVGILHRDIKPANILVGTNGYAKLVDFGLAKEVTRPHDDDATRALTEGGTRPGVVIGTIAYMSPEQASGKPLDPRSDVFSFGVVLYELLAGRRPFGGDTDLEVLQTIVHGRPDPLPKEIPAALRMVIDKALRKDPAERYQTMRDLVVDLRRLVRQPLSAASGTSPRLRWLVAGAAAMLLISAAITLFRFQPSPVAPTPQYFQLTNLDSATQPALSPDGRMLAFVRGTSTFTGEGQIYVKLLPDGDPVQLTHDDVSKMAPRFSPDGSRVAYSTNDGLSGWQVWTVSVIGGQEPRRLLANAEGLAWISETSSLGDTQPRVLFSEATGKGITMAVVSSTESRSDRRTVFVRDEIMAHFSYLSPDRKQLLVAEMGFAGWLPCRLAPFDGSSAGTPVGPDPAQCTSAAWSPDGRWMYFSANTGGGFHIWRQRFPDGTPEQVTFGAAEEEGIAFAPDGRSFLTSIGTRQSTLWVHDSRGDRQVTSDAYAFQPSFSADGKKLFYLVRVGAGGVHKIVGNLWAMDVESGARARVLPDYTMEHYTVSRDGQRVVFVAAAEKGRAGVWIATLDGRSGPRQLASDGSQAFFGADDDVVFGAAEGEGAVIYRVRPDGTDLRKAISHRVHYGPFSVSPDGNHVAAWVQGSTEATARSVVVFPLNGGAPTTVCGTCAGRDSEFPQPVTWSPDGKFVYLSFWGNGTFAIPLRANQMLPPLPAEGIRAVEEAAALPGAQPLPIANAFAGPNPTVYAYSKASAQRNIYRVPVPR
jgi:serine/threonine protein kinase